MGWVFLDSEEDLWTVGFYDPDGLFHPTYDFADKDGAADCCNYLNGGTSGNFVDEESIDPDRRKDVNDGEEDDADEEVLAEDFRRPQL